MADDLPLGPTIPDYSPDQMSVSITVTHGDNEITSTREIASTWPGDPLKPSGVLSEVYAEVFEFLTAKGE